MQTADNGLLKREKGRLLTPSGILLANLASRAKQGQGQLCLWRFQSFSYRHTIVIRLGSGAATLPGSRHSCSTIGEDIIT